MLRSADQAVRGLELLQGVLTDALRGPLGSTHPMLADGPLWIAVHDSGSTVPAGPPRTAPGARDARGPRGGAGPHGDDGDDPEARRLAALVELARGGDVEAFGLLYDHYQPTVYRFLRYRTSSTALAEDLTSETFFKAMRGLGGFRWQGRDFGAWLTTIARNLLLDHAKSARTRFERTSDDLSDFEVATEGPEAQVMATVTVELLHRAMGRLAPEQRECLVLRFIDGCSIAETAAVLRRSEGAVKQLQLRAVRNLAALMPDGMRG